MPALALFLTGFAGLIYEVIWARWFATVYGGTVPAGAAVLSSYLGGLALGSAWLGRRADRSRFPRRLFGWLQVGVGLLGAASLAVPAALPPLYGRLVLHVESSFLLGLLRFALAALFLLPPALLMGGSLPAAVRWRQTGRRRGGARAAGWLRAANCLGATCGAVFAAFVLVPRMGLSGAVLVGAAISFLAAGLAMGLNRKEQDGEAEPEGEGGKPKAGKGKPEAARALPAAVVLLLAVLVGALTLCAELAQVRAVSFYGGSTVRSFAAVTAAYLAALGVGSALGAMLLHRTGRSGAPAALALVLALAGAGAGASAWLLAAAGGWGSASLAALVGCAPTALPLGAAFPLLVSMLRPAAGRVGRAVGSAGAGLELGSTAGPLLAALLLLPLLGARFTLLATGAAAALAAVALAFWAGRRAALTSVFAVALVLPLHADLYGIEEKGMESRLQSQREGLEAVVSLVSIYRDEAGREVKELYVGRKMQADDSVPWLRVEKVMGALPALLCPQGRGRSFHVGLGSGVTAAWSAAAAPGRAVECAELVPGVTDYLAEFRPHNAVGRFEVRLGDGRSRLSAEPGAFELIVTDIVFPEDAGAGGLFSVEYFRLCRRKLAEGGLFAHWLPAHQLSPETLKSVARAFLEVFPEVTLWAASLNQGRPVFMLLGAKGKAGGLFEPAALAARIKRAGLSEEQLAAANLAGPEAVLSHFVCGAGRLREAVGPGRLADDDLPVVEFQAEAEPGRPWSVQNLDLLLQAWEPVLEAGLFDAKGLDRKLRGRVEKLHWSRRMLAEANVGTVKVGADLAMPKMRQAYEENRQDPEIRYALWSLLADVAGHLLDGGQMAPARGLFAEALKVGPKRDYILRGMAQAGHALSSRPGGAIINEESLARALLHAREAKDLRPRDPRNWEVLAEVARAAGQKKEAAYAAQMAARLRKP